MNPQRIQRKRTAGWRMPPDAVYVGRPTRWGNPFTCPTDPQRAVAAYRDWLTSLDTFSVQLGNGLGMSRVPAWWEPGELWEALPVLAGRDLACWCPLEDSEGNRVPCHADVLLELANGAAS